MAQKKNILFICTGNVCRSPMAEGLFRHSAGEAEYEIRSAGVGAMDGQPPSSHSVTAMQEIGIDITEQRSARLTAELVDWADYIFGMTHSHTDAVNLMFPQATEKAFRIREFNPNLRDFEKEIADPIGGPLDLYRQTRNEIQDAIKHMSEFIAQSSNSSEKKSENSSRSLVIAIGSDHAGFNLKQELLGALQSLGHETTDLGTHSEVSTDYPDFAKPVAERVAGGTADAGILVCSSGIGMSVAANKVDGVRAALALNPEMASLSREHNNANVLCLGAKFTDSAVAKEIVEAFLRAEFQGGRHERRIGKLASEDRITSHRVRKTDSAIADVIELERKRQLENIELIASENFTSPAIMEVQGSVLTNKYAEGYPAKRWYGGCEHVDDAETLAIERAKKLFGAAHANVQPHSGSGANMAVYFATLQPGDKLLTMDLSHGGHLTHGNQANFSGRFFDIVHYGVGKDDERIDYDQLEAMAAEHKPNMITVGASAYPRIIDFERMGQIAKSVGALLLADIAHIAGLVPAGEHPSPVGHADFVTTTTHKTLRGPRGGLILCGEEYAKKIDSQTFPGIQGGPLMHVIAAKAVCFLEALKPEFKTYQQQVVKNAKALAEGLARNQFRLVSGGTENHCMLVDVGSRGMTGKECQLALDEAGITVNKNTIPFETRSPFQASGIRLGSPAVTTRGMKEPEMAAIADMISEVLLDIKNVDGRDAVRQRVRELTASYPLPY